MNIPDSFKDLSALNALCSEDNELVQQLTQEELTKYYILAFRNNLEYAFISKVIDNLDSSQLLNVTGLNKDQLISYYQRREQQKCDVAFALENMGRQIDIPVMFIKSFPTYPFVDNDLDSLIIGPENFTKMADYLLDNEYEEWASGAEWRERDRRWFLSPKISDPVIHLHSNVSWQSIPYLDSNEMWERRVEIEQSGKKITVPSATDEIMIIAAHSSFEGKYITVGDLIYLKDMLESGLDTDYLRKTTSKFNWYHCWQYFAGMVNKIWEDMGYDCRLPDSKENAQYKMRYNLFYYPFPCSTINNLRKMVLDVFKAPELLPRDVISYLFFDPLLYFVLPYRKRNKENVKQDQRELR